MRSRPTSKRPVTSGSYNNNPQRSYSDRESDDFLLLPETIQQATATSIITNNTTTNDNHGNNNKRKRSRTKGQYNIALIRNMQIFLGKYNIQLSHLLVCVVLVISVTLLTVRHSPYSGFQPQWTRRNDAVNVSISNNNDKIKQQPVQPRKLIISPLTEGFDIIFTTAQKSTSTKNNYFPPLDKFGRHRRRAAKRRDYGELEIYFLEDERRRIQRREIYHDYENDRGYDDLSAARQDDDDHHDYYYAFDDDYKRNPYSGWHDDKIRDKKHCRRTKWHRDLPINCNSVHEFNINNKFGENKARYLGGGAYREVYTAESDYNVTYVFKSFYFGSKFSYEDYEFMRMDAIVAEKLSYSPRIVDIYSYCALGMINEAMHNGDMENVAVPGKGRIGHKLPPGKEAEPRNKLTPLQKLKYSLDMVEAVVLLHGYRDGVIVHDDIQLSQFLLDAKGNLKLNDFNRAEIMFWNDKDQEYCRYSNNPGHGDWRAPQEYKDDPLDEKIDIFSLGNNMYALLTGLYPFYYVKDAVEVKNHVEKGEVAVIDPGYLQRSLAERRLAEIVPLCWEYDPIKRIDVFELADRLRSAYKEVTATP